MSTKPTKKKQKLIKTKEINIYDTDHPLRRTAIELIQNVIEPLLNRGINGERYYNLQDNLTLAMEKRLKKLLIKPIKTDATKTNPRKLSKITRADQDKDYVPFSEDAFEENDD